MLALFHIIRNKMTDWMLRKNLFLCVLLACLHISVNAAPQPLPLEYFGAIPTTSMVEISPSGNRIAYRTTSADKDYFVVFDLHENKMVNAIDVSTVKPSFAYFISDDQLVFVAEETRRIRGFRGRHDISAAFHYNIETQKISQMLSGDNIYAGQAALGRVLAISEDKQFAYMPVWTDATEYSLVRVKLGKRLRPRILKKGPEDTIDYFVRPDGTVLARERYNNRTNKHLVQAYQDDNWVTIYEEIAEIRTKSISGITPDGESLVISSFDRKLNRWGYNTMSLVDGTISEPIFIKESADIARLITDVNRVVYGVVYSGFKPTYEFFDDKLTRRLEAIGNAMPDNAFYITSHTPDWSSIIFRLEGASTPGDYYKFSQGSFQFIASRRKNITPDQVSPITIDAIEVRDGHIIPTLLTTPVATEAKNLPAIMLPHGGPESHDTLSFDWIAQYFANRGYAVIQPQFRGSSGFGEYHSQLGDGQWGLKMQDDLTDTLAYYAEQGIIDSANVCIVGASYGGYAALAGAAFTPELYKCVVSIAGVSDVEAMLKQERRDHGSNHWVVSYWEKNISKGQFAEDHLEQISPINHIDKITAPVLLIHGEHDLVVPYDQSEEMFDALEDADKSVEYILLDEGDHYLRNYQNRMQTLQAIDAFVKQHM
ncbi:S9 family peptidase [Alteromonas sp. KUL49]|nr:S9 family peptidase [Alteromonas sp. KUL49]